jgi:lysophospholipase L1-like esterase
LPGSPFAGGFHDQTIRNVVYTSAGGVVVRVRLDNTFGGRALDVARAAIAVSGPGAAVVPGTSVPLSFAGRRSTVIPSGAQTFSDPVHLEVRPLERLAVSLFLPRATGAPTEHDYAHESNYLAAGDTVLAGRAAGWGSPLDTWYFVSGLDVWSSDQGAVVALGDSITTGGGSMTGANASWPADLARRLAALPGATLSVVDAAIDGNRLLLSPTSCCGPSAVARFQRDVVRQSGMAEVLVLEGIDDITSNRSTNPLAVPHVNVSAREIIAAYQQLTSRAHAAGLKIFGSTLTPFAGSRYWTPTGEAKREAVNAWIRSSGAFDGVIDFARVLADPNDPVRLNPRFDAGDHEHPNDAGYQAMADAINLTMLLRGLPACG